jgi:hypothetical protein
MTKSTIEHTDERADVTLSAGLNERGSMMTLVADIRAATPAAVWPRRLVTALTGCTNSKQIVRPFRVRCRRMASIERRVATVVLNVAIAVIGGQSDVEFFNSCR